MVRGDVAGMKDQMTGFGMQLCDILKVLKDKPSKTPTVVPVLIPPIESTPKKGPTGRPDPVPILEEIPHIASQVFTATPPGTGVGQEGIGLPAPRDLKKLPQHQGYIERHLHMEEMRHQPTDGKAMFMT